MPWKYGLPLIPHLLLVPNWILLSRPVPIGSMAVHANTRTDFRLFAGFDLGTSGVRISIIEADKSSQDSEYREVYTQALTWDEDSIGRYDDADAWMKAVEKLFENASSNLDGGLASIASICISGTSASCLMVHRQSRKVTRPPRMYNYDVSVAAKKSGDMILQQAARDALQLLDRHAPLRHTARASTGSLAKLLTWIMEKPLSAKEVFCHQSDYVSMMLTGQSEATKSDWHNCLKLGYDVREQCWPEWFVDCLRDGGVSNPLVQPTGVIPLEVISPGGPMGQIDREVSERLGLSHDTIVVGGTTDSNAAFFAAAGTKPSYGTAVTSLGSTLAIKQLSQSYVEDADRGVYSHRFPNFDNHEEAWLVGGASNVGCAVLRHFNFSNEELVELSLSIDPSKDSQLTYYPLTQVGERFPIADSSKEPLLEPVPESRQDFLHGILQSISDVETAGFSVLQQLGAPVPTVVWTCGGGSKNKIWSRLRERRLAASFQGADIKVRKAKCTEASFGAALLAAATFNDKA